MADADDVSCYDLYIITSRRPSLAHAGTRPLHSSQESPSLRHLVSHPRFIAASPESLSVKMKFAAVFATVLAATVSSVSAQSSEVVYTLTPCPPSATTTGGSGSPVVTPPAFTGAANAMALPAGLAALPIFAALMA